MKNLASVDYNKLDILPEKLPFIFRTNTKYVPIYNWNSRRWDNNKRASFYKKADHIIKAGVNKKWDITFSNLSFLIKNITFNLTIERLYSDVLFIHKDPVTGKEMFHSKWNALRNITHLTAQEYINKIANDTFYHTLYYVDNDGILRRAVSKYRKDTSLKKHIKDIQWKQKIKRDRKRNKKERFEYQLTLLKIINKPDLYKFYLELKSKEKELLVKINKKPDVYPVRKYYTQKYNGHSFKRVPITDKSIIEKEYNRAVSWWNLYEKFRKKDAETAKKEIIPIQAQLKELENGNFNVFFESNVYLYSIQKECHHFETP